MTNASWTLITGASSGIGAATARKLAQAGHKLLLVARREDRLTALRAECLAAGSPACEVHTADVRDQASLIPVLQDPGRPISVLINNAGLARGLEPLQTATAEDIDEVLDTNVRAVFRITRLALPSIIAQRGHIVNLGSVAGYWTYPKGAVYCASKAAIRTLTEALRMDLAGTGVRVTEIAPGMVETEFSEVRLRDAERARKVYDGRTPLTPEDIAETIAWCLARPAHVDVQSLVIFPTEQASVHAVARG